MNKSGSDIPENWVTIKSLTFTAIGIKSIVFTAEYKYYRALWTITGTVLSFTFTAGIVETYVDRWIVWKALQMIFQDFSKDPTDIWSERAKSALNTFEMMLNNSKYMTDKNDDNIPDETEEHPSQTTFVR